MNGFNLDPIRKSIEEVGKTVEGQAVLLNKLGNDEAFAKESAALLERTKDTTFRLLIMGIFNSGKSSFINVLLGEKLLPTKALPATALITEIYYGEKKKVVMYPHPGKWQGGNAPFEIKPEEMAQYCLINNETKEGNKIDTRFQKMVIYWPLPLLRDGVVIVDSPGLDDPYSHDEIAKNYVPSADAIIFCVNGAVPYTARDRSELETLNALGFKTPIFVTTRFDNIRSGSTSSELEEYVKVNTDNYLNHSSLGPKACHFVDSMEGLRGKQADDHAALVKSGYYELEKYLSEYLTDNKGRDQVASLTKAVMNLNRKAIARATMMLSTADEPIREFEERLEGAGKKLDDARRQGELLVREFRMSVKDIEISAKPMVEEMAASLAANISLEDYEPAASFTLKHPTKSAEAITEECCDEIKRRNETFIGNWINETLVPWLTQSLQEVTTRMEGSFDRFVRDIETVEIILTHNKNSGPRPKEKGAGMGSRVAGFAYALFTGDIVTGLIGGTMGFGAMGRAMAYQFMAGIILGIVGLFTPVGLPAMIIAAIFANVAALVRTAQLATKNRKKKVESEYKAHFAKAETKAELLRSVTEKLKAYIDTLTENLQEAIDSDISEKEGDIRNILDERQAAQGDISAKKAEWAALIEAFKVLDARMDDLRRENHIA